MILEQRMKREIVHECGTWLGANSWDAVELDKFPDQRRSGCEHAFLCRNQGWRTNAIATVLEKNHRRLMRNKFSRTKN